MRDTRIRSLVKGFSWRALGTIDTFLLAFFICGSLPHAATIAGAEIFTKVIFFYLHERIWNSVEWGRKTTKSSHVRSVIKGVSWRIIGSLDTFILSLWVTNHKLCAMGVASTELLSKLVLYYLHERLWNWIKWGRIFDDRIVPVNDSGDNGYKTN